VVPNPKPKKEEAPKKAKVVEEVKAKEPKKEATKKKVAKKKVAKKKGRPAKKK
jgi:hypothetical protein